MRRILIFTAMVGALLSTQCSNGNQFKTNVTGKAGEIIVVMNKDYWEAAPGQELRSLLAVDFPFLPQSEPLFTLVNIPESAFSSLFQSHRNLILFNILSDLPEAKMMIQKDIWAAPQIVITLSGPTAESVQQCIVENQDKIRNALEQAERNRVIQNARKYEEVSLRNAVTAFIGGSPYFPNGYKLKKQTDNFMWIAYETTYTNQAILLYTYPYRDQEDLTLPRILAECNLVMEKEVPGPTENSYMTTNSMITPELRWVNYNNREFAEIRGLWDVKNDFMAGPFVSHCFYDKENNRVIVMEAFVYAPKYQKRNYLRQVESILYSFEWQNTQKNL